uniref:EGF-like domain-containing protein n=1 Tax=Fundulus heteroclitus TaxID=8078 RepID=A0A3Q2U6W0_FUNHE
MPSKPNKCHSCRQQLHFTGGLRELKINGRELELTETGAVGGTNIGDWDGTACGYKVCHNGGRCRPTGADSFVCICPSSWTGSVCNQSVSCVNNSCRHGSMCAPSTVPSYSCICPLGWGGTYCDAKVSSDTFRFVGNSHIKYRDQRFNTRNLKYTQVSFSVYASSGDGLIAWLGMAEHEDDDYLAVGTAAPSRVALLQSNADQLAESAFSLNYKKHKYSWGCIGLKSNPGSFFMEFACSPCACVGSLRVLRLPPTV